MIKKKYSRNTLWTVEGEEIVLEFLKKQKVSSYKVSDLTKNPLLLVLKQQLDNQFEGKLKLINC